MVVNEKGLLSAMKDAYKTVGYQVAVDESGGIENAIIHNPMWTVVIMKSELPRKVLGMIAEHIGVIPRVGTAFQVKKKETQTEIFNIVAGAPMEYHSDNQPSRIARRTSLTLGGLPLWQTATDQKVVKVYPDYEDIINWGNNLVRLVGDDVLMIDDDVSRAYIRATNPKDGPELAMMNHLAQIKWVSE